MSGHFGVINAGKKKFRGYTKMGASPIHDPTLLKIYKGRLPEAVYRTSEGATFARAIDAHKALLGVILQGPEFFALAEALNSAKEGRAFAIPPAHFTSARGSDPERTLLLWIHKYVRFKVSCYLAHFLTPPPPSHPPSPFAASR